MLLRKKALELRRRFQRTKTGDNLRQERGQLYLECNRLYQTKLREDKLKSWKDFCSSTESSNPWNAVYRYAAGKLRSMLIPKTLKSSNNIYTTDIQSTINQMMDHFVPEDSDEIHHKRARQQVMEPFYTTNDDAFTRQEIQQYWEGLTLVKHPAKTPLTARYFCTFLGASPPFSRRFTSA